MESLPGYDEWKLATPPEYEREDSDEPEYDAVEEIEREELRDEAQS